MGKSKYEATIDQLRSLANGSMHGAVDDAGAAAKKMHGLTGSGIDHTALSAIPSCVQFQKVLSDAMATYAEVVAGIEQDVAAFHNALHKTAETMQHNDESAAVAITAIATKLNAPLATHQRGQRAYDKHHSLHNGRASDAPRVPGAGRPATGQPGAGQPAAGQPNSTQPGTAQPSATTSASAPPNANTTYDAKTGNAVPSASTSAGAPPSSTPTSTPSTTAGAPPSSTPTPTPSTAAGAPPN